MNTYQLQCAIDCDFYMKKSILGVYAADEIPQTLHSLNGFIANTDPYHQPGKHWVAFLYDNDTLECFDSFGKSPDLYSTHFARFMDKFNNIKVNTKQLQSSDTTVCGQYCLFYLMCRTRGYSMDQVINIFHQNYSLNDHFVYMFIDERFYCCMSCRGIHCQTCTCLK